MQDVRDISQLHNLAGKLSRYFQFPVLCILLIYFDLLLSVGHSLSLAGGPILLPRVWCPHAVHPRHNPGYPGLTRILASAIGRQEIQHSWNHGLTPSCKIFTFSGECRKQFLCHWPGRFMWTNHLCWRLRSFTASSSSCAYCDCESSSPKSPQSYDVFLTLPMCCHSLHSAPRQVLPAAASLSRVADAWAASLATRQLHKNNIAIENGHL